MLSQGATWFVSIVLLIVVPGELGEALYGEFTFAFMYMTFVSLVAAFGTHQYLTKTVARRTDEVGRYVWNTVLLRTVSALSIGGLALLFGVLVGFDSLRMTLVAVFGIGMVLDVVNGALAGGLQGLQQMGRPALLLVARSYAGAIIGIPLLLATGSVVWYALAFNVVAIIPLIGNALGLRAALRGHHDVDLPLWREIVVGGAPFFVLSALTVLYGAVDIPMIDAFTDSETVGWYGLSYKWISMPAFVAAAVATATFPALSAQGVELGPGFSRMANRAMQLVVFVSAPCAIGMALVAEDFIAFLYGEEFQQAVPLMQILALSVPIVGFDIILGAVAAIMAIVAPKGL